MMNELHGFEAGEIAGENATLPYRLFTPEDYRDDGAYPLVLTLHGAGERGNDNESHLMRNALLYADDEVQSFQPAFVVAPQCPAGESWAAVTGWDEGARPLREITDPTSAVVELLDHLLATYPIDPERQHVAGFSMGGYGTWDLLSRFPDRFEAATPLSGGGVPDRAAELDDVRVWAFHGADDEIVPVSGTREQIQAMRDAGLEPRYTEFEGGHTTEPALSREELPEWMLEWEDDDTPADDALVVTAGETLVVEADVTNAGDAAGSQDITLSKDGAPVDAEEDLELVESNVEHVALEWRTRSGDEGQWTVAVSSDDDADSIDVEVRS